MSVENPKESTKKHPGSNKQIYQGQKTKGQYIKIDFNPSCMYEKVAFEFFKTLHL